MENLNWLQNWYKKQIDGDWEHTYGVAIKTIDNPGWHIEIDLNETSYEHLNSEFKLIDNSKDDWYGVEIKNKKYIGVGDPSKLDFLIKIFRKFVE